MNLDPLWISLKTATVATLVAFALAVLLARYRLTTNRITGNILDGVMLLPLALPPTVIGLLLLLLFGRESLIGEFLERYGWAVVFSWKATVLASLVMALPILYHTIAAGFRQIDRELIDTARLFGSSEWHTLWNVMLPLAWPSIAAGAMLAFMRALGEFGATLMIAGNIPGRTQTAPLAIFVAVQSGEIREAVILSLILLAVAASALALLKRLPLEQTR